MVIKVEMITQNEIKDFLSVALSGNTWCSVCNEKLMTPRNGEWDGTIEDKMAWNIVCGKGVTFSDTEDENEEWVLTYDKLKDRLSDIMSDELPLEQPIDSADGQRAAFKWATWDEDMDANDADLLLQLILFAEVVYG